MLNLLRSRVATVVCVQVLHHGAAYTPTALLTHRPDPHFAFKEYCWTDRCHNYMLLQISLARSMQQQQQQQQQSQQLSRKTELLETQQHFTYNVTRA